MHLRFADGIPGVVMADSIPVPGSAAAPPILPPPSPAFRWAVLAVLGGSLFAGGYLFDCIGPLAKVLASQLGYSNADIGLLQAAASLPNLVMVLVGGIIIDRIGVHRSLLVFSATCLAGVVLTSLSPRLGIMAAGRLVYGLGSGSLSVAVSTAIGKWFRGPRLSFSYGLSLTLQRIGSLAAQTGPAWAAGLYLHWRRPLLLALVVAVASLASAGVYGTLERRAAVRYDLGPRREGGAGPLRLDRLRFNRSYWLLVLLCVTYYSGIFPFQTFAQKFLIEARGVSAARASMLAGIPTIIALVASPLCGLLADRVGRRTQFLAAGTLLLVPVYLLMACTRLDLALPMALMGASFALVPAVLWPAVMLVVPRGQLGTAFGLMQMVQAFGLVGFNFLIGWANDACRAGEANPGGYRLGMALFTTTVLAGLGIALALRRRERGPQGHGLESPSGRRPERTALV
jgi:MFS family permease